MDHSTFCIRVMKTVAFNFLFNFEKYIEFRYVKYASGHLSSYCNMVRCSINYPVMCCVAICLSRLQHRSSRFFLFIALTIFHHEYSTFSVMKCRKSINGKTYSTMFWYFAHQERTVIVKYHKPYKRTPFQYSSV